MDNLEARTTCPPDWDQEEWQDARLDVELDQDGERVLLLIRVGPRDKGCWLEMDMSKWQGLVRQVDALLAAENE